MIRSDTPPFESSHMVPFPACYPVLIWRPQDNDGVTLVELVITFDFKVC